MPALVHALIVARPDGRVAAALHLKRTLAAIEAQSRRPDAVTIVLCGADPALRTLAAASGAEAVIEASGATSYARAVGLALRRVHDDSALWLLAQDTAPEPDALERLEGALELSPSVAIAAPKLVQWDDRDSIVSLGVTMTLLGRSLGLADGEYDQGQHDTREDVLGSDVRGVLVRGSARDRLAPDPALAGADEGLDMGVRARLGGWRVVLVPAARIAVAGDGTAGLPSAETGRASRRRAFASRTAQLHRRLTYASTPLVPLHLLLIVPSAIGRTIIDLIAKTPGSIISEWRAAFVAMCRWGAIARSRRALKSGRTASWASIDPLRVSRRQMRHRFDDGGEPAAQVPARRELRFFSGGGAWVVLAALVVSVASFTALLAWPVLGGGALLPLRTTVAGLWQDAAYGVRATGLGEVAPADPFAGVVALVGSLWPGAPSFALVLLWVLALPLAALGGWFAATRVTDRSALRIVAAVVWALAPTFLAALVQGRPAAVMVHLVLPWLFFVGSVAYRSWGAAGATSLLFLITAACAPSLMPALAAVWGAAVIVVVVARRGRGLARVLWLVVPTAVVFAPLAWEQVRAGNPLALLADPGVVWAGPQVTADAAGRALLAAGFPTSDPGGWGALLSPAGIDVWWVPLLAAPLFVVALLSPLTPRWPAAIVLLFVLIAGLGTAFGAAGIAVQFAGSQPVPLWPGAGLSFAWIGVTGAALVALDAALMPRVRFARPVVASVATLGIALLSIAPLTAMARDQSFLTNGPASSLPAYVAAEGQGDTPVGTFVITPQNAGGAAASVVWGASETIGGQSTILSTRTEPTSSDRVLAGLVADLVTPTSVDAAASLSGLGVSFVLLAPASAPESEAARTFRLEAVTSIDQRAGFVPVGQTDKGVLWRVTGEPAAPAELTRQESETAHAVTLSQLAVLAIALLLAVPTGASRRAARRSTRVVGVPAGTVTEGHA